LVLISIAARRINANRYAARMTNTLNRIKAPSWFVTSQHATILAFALTCGFAHADSDFAAIYAEVPVKGFLIAGLRTLPIRRVSSTEWQLQLPSEVPESIMPRLWRRVPPVDIARLFADGTPVEKVECIAPLPLSITPMFCKVPEGPDLAFRENGRSWNPVISTTGFLFVFGSPAGVHGVEFRKVE